ncbi:MAG: hypothetical protein ACR2N7_07005 [Acidimicrobiia bacterium]
MSAIRLVAVTVCLLLAGAACSSALTTEEYAESIGALTDAYVIESQNLSYDYQSAVEDGVRAIVAEEAPDSEEAAVALIANESVQYLALLGDSMDRYIIALDALAPPGSLDTEHDAYVAAIVAVHGALPQTRDAVGVATDIPAIQLALSSSGFADGQIRWTATCTVLEEAIRAEGRGVDLRCLRSEVTP